MARNQLRRRQQRRQGEHEEDGVRADLRDWKGETIRVFDGHFN